MVATVTLKPFATRKSDFLPDRALTWVETTNGEIAVACENGHIAFLHPDHFIADDGSITPSLGCPDEDCDWHVMGRLEGYQNNGA